MIYRVEEKEGAENDGADDNIYAVNHSRVISTIREDGEEGYQESVPADFIEAMREEEDRVSENPSATKLILTHHNGGPVQWSTTHQAMVDTPFTREQAEEIIRLADLPDGSDSLRLIPHMDGLATIVFGKFTEVMQIAKRLRDEEFGSKGDTSTLARIRVESCSGFAKWTRAQFLSEMTKGNWGMVEDGVKYVTQDKHSSQCLWADLIDSSCMYTSHNEDR